MIPVNQLTRHQGLARVNKPYGGGENMKRVEDLISIYMVSYSVSYREAIAVMMTDLETAKDDEELVGEAEHDASKLRER